MAAAISVPKIVQLLPVEEHAIVLERGDHYNKKEGRGEICFPNGSVRTAVGWG